MSTPDACKIPPPGWYCTRPAGHPGPCAAWPRPSDDQIREWWRAVTGPQAELTGPLIRFAARAFATGLAVGAQVEREPQPSAPPDGLSAEQSDIGPSIDMLDADRLRNWSRNISDYGPDVTHWTTTQWLAGALATIATSVEIAVCDIGTLRARDREQTAEIARLSTADAMSREYRAALQESERRREAQTAEVARLTAERDRLREALDAIASPVQVADYGWWTRLARQALGISLSAPPILSTPTPPPSAGETGDPR